MNSGKSQSTKIELDMHIHKEVFGTGFRYKVESPEHSNTMDFRNTVQVNPLNGNQ